MDGDKGINTVFVSIGLTMLFGVLLFSPIGLASAEDSASTPTLIDGRIAGFQAEPSESHVREWSMAEGEWFSLDPCPEPAHRKHVHHASRLGHSI